MPPAREHATGENNFAQNQSVDVNVTLERVQHSQLERPEGSKRLTFFLFSDIIMLSLGTVFGQEPAQAFV